MVIKKLEKVKILRNKKKGKRANAVHPSFDF
jgi:hypothetical protein